MRRVLLLALLLGACRDYDRLRDGLEDGGATKNPAPDADIIDAARGHGDPCAGAFLCEPFEGQLSPQWLMPISSEGPATIMLDHTHVHSGSQAAHVRVDEPTMNTSDAYVGLQLPI
ncbi:MAG: hypothetical protein ABI321_02340, partial [Polyangia bacterium]